MGVRTYDKDGNRIGGEGAPPSRVVEDVVATASAGAAHEVDCDAGTVHEITLDAADCTISFSNVPAGGFGITLELVQDGTGSRTVTWPAAVTWAGGAAPTLTTDANAVDVVTMYTPDGGTTWRGFLAGLDFS